MSGSHRATGRSRFLIPGMLVLVLLVVAVGVLIARVATNSGSGTAAGRHVASRPAAVVTTTPPTGTAVAAGPAQPSTASPATSSSSSSSSSATSSSATASATTPTKPLTYTVKPGDNLWDIAAWFHMHGYGSLYDANKAVLGDDPALIHPGQTITVSGTGMTTG